MGEWAQRLRATDRFSVGHQQKRSRPLRAIASVDWLGAVLLLSAIWVMVATLEIGDWAPTPSLAFVAFLGILTAGVFAQVPVSAVLLHPAALGVGAWTILWQASLVVSGSSFAERLSNLLLRLSLWMDAARHQGISTDDVPFAFILVTATWLVAYISAWAFFRARGVWGAVILPTMAILANLAYLPANNTSYFFLYAMLALLLIVRVYSNQRVADWRTRRVNAADGLTYVALWNGLWLGMIIVVVAFMLPVAGRSMTLAPVYNFSRAPAERLRSDFNRLFAALPARKPMPYNDFESVLPFKGTIRLGTSPVLEITSPRPMYWRAHAYSQYTSKGWRLGDTTEVAPSYIPPDPLPEQYTAREEVKYSIVPSSDIGTLFTGGQLVEAPGDTRVDVPEPMRYDVNVQTGAVARERGAPTVFIPQDIQAVAEGLRQRAAAGELTSPKTVEASLPGDLTMAGVKERGSNVTEVTLERRQPQSADPLGLETKSTVRAGQQYDLTASVSDATPGQLQAAGTEYPGWVRDRYLDIPPTLPQRVRSLAEDITRGAPTPYDKAQAIIAYMSSFRYTHDIPAPPYDADGVDYFLFDLKRGYSDYFASALTVMLRSAGVPARLAAGYAPGGLTESNTYLVREGDSHAWTEVYFPNYGWVEFEATPGLPSLNQIPRPAVTPAPIAEAPTGDTSAPLPEEEDSPVPPNSFGLGVQTGTLGDVVRSLAVWLLAAAIAALAGLLAWARWMGMPAPVEGGDGPTSPITRSSLLSRRRNRTPRNYSATVEGAYWRMSRMARFAGVPQRSNQTPREHAAAVRDLAPDHGEHVSAIAEAYVRSRYGGDGVGAVDAARARLAWAALRLSLLRRVFDRRR